MKIALASCLVLASKLLLVVPPYFIGEIVNGLAGDVSVGTLTNNAVLLVASSVLLFVVSPMATYLLNNIIQDRVETQSLKWMDNVFSKDTYFLEQHGSGELISKVDRGIAAFERYIHFVLAFLVPLAVEIVVLSVFLGWVGHWSLILIVAGYALLFSALQYTMIKSRRPFIEDINDAEDNVSDIISDMLPGVRTVQTHKAGEFVRALFTPVFSAYKSASVKLAVSGSWLDLVGFAFSQITLVTVIIVGAVLLVPVGVLEVGTLVMTITVVGLLTKGINSALSHLRTLDGHRVEYLAAKPFFEVSDRPLASAEVEGAYSVKVLKSTATDKPRRVALVGDSGSGKSTLLKSVVDGHSTVLNDHLPGAFPIKSGQSCSYLDQKNFVFKGDVSSNITLGKVIDRRIQSEVIKALNLDKRLSLDEIVSGNNSDLSGGETRRLCLARALISPIDWVILDEPTTGLDINNVRAVWDVIFSFSSGRSLIVATHDQSCLDEFDVVFKVEPRPSAGIQVPAGEENEELLC